MIRKHKNLIAIIVIIFAFVTLWFKEGFIMGGGESGLPFYDLEATYENSRYAWSDYILGGPRGIGAAGTPTYWLLAQLQNIGIPSFVIQAIFIGFLFIVSGISIYKLTKDFFPKIEEKYLLLATFFYWFNPFSLVNVWKRFLYNYMVFWALFPLAIWLFYRGILKRDYRFALLTVLSTAVFSYALTSTVFNILLLSTLVFILVLYFILNKKDWAFYLKYILITLISFLLLHTWWIGQLLSFITSSNFSGVLIEYFRESSNLSTLTALSNILGDFTYTSRFMHERFFTDPDVYWISIYRFPPVVLFEFAISGIILWTIYRYRKLRAVLILGTLMISSLFLVKGNNAPFGEIFGFIFSKVTLLQVFRNPFEKFGFVLPLVAAPLFTFGVYKLNQRLVSRKMRQNLLIGFYFFIIAIWGFPFWTKLVFTYKDGADKNKLLSYETKIPAYYKEVSDWFEDQRGDYRALVLPIGGEGITYNWDKKYSGVESSSALISLPNISFNTSILYYSSLAKQLSKYQNNRNVLDFFPYTNSKYIIWRGDIDYKERKMANPDNTKKILDDWVQVGLIKNSINKGKLSVYEVDDKWFWPKIYATSNIMLTNLTDFSNLSEFIEGFPSRRAVFVSDNNIQLSGLKENTTKIIAPEEETIVKMTTPLPRDLTEEDLLGRLFHAKHLPDKWYYPLVKIKERLSETSRDDYYGWIIYKTGTLGKRAVEVYKLRRKGANKDTILVAESNYRNELETMRHDLLDFVESEGPIAELIRDSLSYQWVLLDRVGSKESGYLSDLLINWGIKPKFELPVSSENYNVYSLEIPQENSYEISLDERGHKVKNMFVDGFEVDLFYSSLIYLSEGEHEIALVLEEGPEDPITDIGRIKLSNTSLFSKNIDIPDLPSTYSIEFDYRFIEGSIFEVHFVQDIDRDISPVFSSGVRKDPTYHGWRHFVKEFTSTPGSDLGELRMIPVEEEVCKELLLWKRDCVKKEIGFDVEISNLKFSKLNFPKVRIVSDLNQGINNKEMDLDWYKVNPTEYKVEVTKLNDVPEMLVFSELYDSGWEIRFEDGSVIPENRHFLVNVYANGWLLEKAGEYNITLKFKPQNILYKGKSVSVISLFVGIIALGIFSWKKKRR